MHSPTRILTTATSLLLLTLTPAIHAQEPSVSVSAITQISDGQIQAPGPTSYSNPSEQYTSLTNSLGVITGQPSVITTQPSVITTQPSVITSQPTIVTDQDPAATYESGIPGVPLSGGGADNSTTTLATVLVTSAPGNGNLSTSTRTATQTQTQTATGTGEGFQGPESTGAAASIRGGGVLVGAFAAVMVGGLWL